MMQAQYKVLGEGSAMLQAAIAQAKRENREINKDEMDEIVRKNHGVFPPVILEGQEKATLKFETFQTVNDEKVIVRLHDGIRLVEFTLVKVDEKWFISCGKTVKIDA